MRLERTIAGAAAAAAVALILGGCAADPAENAAAPATAAPVAATCVADPHEVATTPLPAAATAPVDDATAAALDEAAAAGFALASAPGAVVAVQTPEGTWTASYGDADPAAKIPMTADVHHRIGSVTKTFTGTVLLQLAEQGALSLDDPVEKYFDGVTDGDLITVRMLLNMTSGIASYTLDEDFQAALFADPMRVYTPDELIAMGLALPQKFEPGAQFDYSNTNFVMLGRIAELVTGEPFATVLGELVLEPLGLGDTAMPSADEVQLPPPSSRGFTLQGTPDDSTDPVDATDWNPTWAWTAGQMTSTAADLLVYGRALGTGQGLLGEDAQVERLTSMAPKGGYGLGAGCLDGWFGHTGELPGFNTALYYDTTSDTTVVVLANSDIPSGDCTDSKTLADDPGTEPCMDPAVRIFAAVSTALGHTFTPLPKS
ncbi:serine hydrolase domain-containing protein [Agromyces sp. H66]|uniref:serine hydrolase domain-containing protein n=1 Tax=Agromyces sp. H66 TaxID=2529859 RepID=UPI001B7D78E3|nr:serine hydrolase domain-containing protein [Agromyces sp. H66]